MPGGVVVFRERLLGASETFIRAQGEGIAGIPLDYLGLEAVPGGLPLPSERVRVAFAGPFAGLRRRGFRATGWSPRVAATLAGLGPRLVHAHFLWDAAYILPTCRRLGIPLLATCHGSDVRFRYRGWYTRPLVRRRPALWRYARRILCVSESLRRRLVATGCPEALTRTHYTGIDTAFFACDRAAAPGPVAVFVGRLIPQKGCDRFLRAAAAIRAAVPGLRVVVAGTGPEEAALRRQAGRDLGAACTFAGACAPAAVRELLAGARVLCGPSQPGEDGAEEGLGMVFLEAAAMGVPVVATRLGGIPEAVVDGATGTLVAADDEAGLADGLRRVLTDPGLWAARSRAARAHVTARFDLATQSRALAALYAEVLAEAPAVSP